MAIILWTLYGVLLLFKSSCSGINIEQCSPGPKYVYKHTPVQLTCGQCRDKIEWYVRADNDQREKNVGECIKSTCNVEDKTAFRLHANMRNELYSSVLVIINISQPDPLYVLCKCYRFYKKFLSRKYDLEESPWCKIITVPKSIVPEGFSVQLSGWKVSGMCTVQWQDGQTIPMCNWSLKYKSKSRDLPNLHGPTTFVKQGSVLYKRRNCTFEVDMPVDDGDYTYSVTVPSHPADHFSKTLRIEQPEVPKHNCPEMVLEGSSINCTCYTSKIGNPPAHIAWSESNNEHLVVDNVGKENSGIFDVCYLSWGNISKETVYTIQVLHYKQSYDTIGISGIAVAAVIISVVGARIFVYIIKQQLVVSNCTTQSPVVHNAAPSCDLYTIAGTTIEDHGENENVTLCNTFDNINYHQAGAAPSQTNEVRKTLKPILKPPEQAHTTRMSLDCQLTIAWACITMVPWQQCLGIRNLIQPNETIETVFPINQYNDLQFHVHSSGHDRTETYYNNLNLK